LEIPNLAVVLSGVLGVILTNVLLCAASLARELPYFNVRPAECTRPERHTFNVIPIFLLGSLLPTSMGARRMCAFQTDVYTGDSWWAFQDCRLAFVTRCTRRTLTFHPVPLRGTSSRYLVWTSRIHWCREDICIDNRCEFRWLSICSEVWALARRTMCMSDAGRHRISTS
jgi:hypothetical protein